MGISSSMMNTRGYWMEHPEAALILEGSSFFFFLRHHLTTECYYKMETSSLKTLLV